jgi:hypothetical protein
MAPVGGPTAHTQGHTTYLLEQGTTVWSTSYKIYMRGSDSPTYVSSGGQRTTRAYLLRPLENE